MKTEFYCQCRMSKGRHKTVGYIPSWAAKVNNQVQLISLDSEFWRVDEVGQKVPVEFVKENERNYKEFQHSTAGGCID